MDLWTVTEWHWLGLGLILMIFELFVGGYFLLWIGVSALVVGLICFALPDLLFETQAIIFSVCAMGAILITFKYTFSVKEKLKKGEVTLNRRADQYIGREFTLESDILHGRGKLRFDDTTWTIEGPDATMGTRMKVVGVQGMILKVNRV